ncbi:hypothetical protein F4779DRAFT_591789 [Xylariaceae sp. FL0662B]|nr:hypothetical protein F4779DRAFT_591789 [Xylariaceae sp. FL0662B]
MSEATSSLPLYVNGDRDLGQVSLDQSPPQSNPTRHILSGYDLNTTSIRADNEIPPGVDYEPLQQPRYLRDIPTEVPVSSTQPRPCSHSASEYVQFQNASQLNHTPRAANNYAPQNGKDNGLKVKHTEHYTSSQAGEPASWWWWWEILAMILSIACMCILVVLLTKINNLPLQSWWLPIEPNSLVAVLTTVAKTSMMVPAASCISQLKWRHFMVQPRRLVDLQLFDGASRGPWGSGLLLWSLSFRVRTFRRNRIRLGNTYRTRNRC